MIFRACVKSPPFLQMCQAPASLFASFVYIMRSLWIFRSTKRFRLRLLCYCVYTRTDVHLKLREKKRFASFTRNQTLWHPSHADQYRRLGNAFQIAFQWAWHLDVATYYVSDASFSFKRIFQISCSVTIQQIVQLPSNGNDKKSVSILTKCLVSSIFTLLNREQFKIPINVKLWKFRFKTLILFWCQFFNDLDFS